MLHDDSSAADWWHHGIARGDERSPEENQREADRGRHGIVAVVDLQMGRVARGQQRERHGQPARPRGSVDPHLKRYARGAMGVRAGRRFLYQQSAQSAAQPAVDPAHERHRAGVCRHARHDRDFLGGQRDHQGGGEKNPRPVGRFENGDRGICPRRRERKFRTTESGRRSEKRVGTLCGTVAGAPAFGSRAVAPLKFWSRCNRSFF